jgi:citrate/tricarballylate utilization protein
MPDAKTGGDAFSSPELAEAERLMRICNACRYCEGLCAVFPGMELRRDFAAGDLRHLANLCHNCGACYHDCQYAPPHDFAVNVPQTLARLRARSWADYAWPRALAPVFARNGAKLAWLTALCVAAFLFGFMWAADPEVMFGRVTGPGAFYAIMPHSAMVALFGAAFGWALLALAMGFRNSWRDVEAGNGPSLAAAPGRPSWRRALSDAASLRYLDGGGMGCGKDLETTEDPRKMWHHMTFYGFLLCLASTSAATVMHYALGWQAPYSWASAPVLLGFWGGLGITIGPLGLLLAKRERPAELGDPSGGGGMDAAFLWMLCGTGATGLALLFWRETAAMGTLLAIHLGFVLAFFLAMPYGRFVHGLYRFAALLRHAAEMRRA